MSALLWWCDFAYTICRVTLPTERVSWNHFRYLSSYTLPFVTLPTERVSWNVDWQSTNSTIICHAPHGACELKSVYVVSIVSMYSSRSPRSVWVEMQLSKLCHILAYVTLPTERVSWNRSAGAKVCVAYVTLPTERVSWNGRQDYHWQHEPSHAPHGACELKFHRMMIGGMV